MKKTVLRKRKAPVAAVEAAKYLGGSLIVYTLFMLVLLFVLERQPSSFIYVSF
jgi:hypothetical protein